MLFCLYMLSECTYATPLDFETVSLEGCEPFLASNTRDFGISRHMILLLCYPFQRVQLRQARSIHHVDVT